MTATSRSVSPAKRPNSVLDASSRTASKRRRQASDVSAATSDVEEMDLSWMDHLNTSLKHSIASQAPATVKPNATKQPYSFASKSKKRRVILIDDDDEDDIKDIPILAGPSDSMSSISSPPPRKQKCKFAKAGCPFTGTSAQVQEHETTYCIPLYTQIAQYKNLVSQFSSSITSSSLSSPSSSPSSAATLSTEAEVEALKAQVTRLQLDLGRAQAQLESEKRLRTERLRKASEKCLELMSLSELGEGKVEVLRMQVKAERELRERTEEELESLRAGLELDKRESKTTRKRDRAASEPDDDSGYATRLSP